VAAAAETDDDFDDDDNDGIADVFVSESTRDELSSSTDQLASGEARDYVMVADANTMSLTGVAANGQAILVEIYNPQGVLIGSSVPGSGVATAPVVLPGNYTIRFRNISLTAVSSDVTRASGNRWP